MPYILSPKIKHGSSGMWMEGPAYEKKMIYSITSGKMPPVNYDEHILRPHSLTHFETPAHTNANGKCLDTFYGDLNYFFGRTLVIKLQGNRYESKGKDIYHWEISKEEVEKKIDSQKSIPNKILISTDFYPLNNDGYHDPNYVLTLSQKAADYLVSLDGFHLYGTSWKSSDFNPGKPERLIHNTLFKKAGILENLDLKNVPEGIYFIAAFPLPLGEASESPVVPVLFTKEELAHHIVNF
jgi:kynurenine formamidase